MESRKKVLYVVTKSVWGGAQKYVFDLAVSIPRDRFEAVVATGGKGPLFEKLREHGVKTISIPSLDRDVRFLKEFKSTIELYKIFRNEKPDVIHLNSSKAGGLGAIAAFLYKTLYPKPSTLNPKVIFTVHGWPFLEQRPWWQKGIILFSLWVSSLFQDRIILIAKSDLKIAEKLRIARSRKLVMIHNGISAPSFLPRHDARAFFETKTGRSLPPDALVFGTIAELTKTKDLENLVRAAALAKQKSQKKFVCLIIGEGEERKNLEKTIKQQGLAETIFLLGFIPDAAHYMKGFDMFLFSSVKEGLPYVLLETMSAGVPPIATSVGGIPDIIDNGVNGFLVPPRNAEALARAMFRVIENPTERNQMGVRAQEKVQKEFSKKEMIEKTLKIYDQ